MSQTLVEGRPEDKPRVAPVFMAKSDSDGTTDGDECPFAPSVSPSNTSISSSSSRGPSSAPLTLSSRTTQTPPCLVLPSSPSSANNNSDNDNNCSNNAKNSDGGREEGDNDSGDNDGKKSTDGGVNRAGEGQSSRTVRGNESSQGEDFFTAQGISGLRVRGIVAATAAAVVVVGVGGLAAFARYSRRR